LVPEEIGLVESYPFRIGRIAVGVCGKPDDWKTVLGGLQSKEMFEKLESAAAKTAGSSEIEIVCPKPVHGMRITSSKELPRLTVSKGQIPVYRDTEADGAEIFPREVYCLASADCLTVTVHNVQTSRTVAVHFSRESCVVGNILERALERFSHSPRRDIVAVITLGIHPDDFLHRWDHPAYGAANRALTESLLREYGENAVGTNPELGGINLRWIAAEKLLRAGLDPANVYADQENTFDSPRWWSHRASHTGGSPKYGDKGRNLVLVANTGVGVVPRRATLP
jgi:copper oxidase (laccase) domain-containing protein